MWLTSHQGSSPLARGLPGHEPGENPGVRIIPARAGFTDHIPCIQVRSGDHPRSRGVYGDDGEIRDVAYGSSPLARGLLDTALPGQAPGRIIPARAGFTHSSFLGRLFATDHPRSRGVYVAYFQTKSGVWGSSPLARGLLEEIIRREGHGRIIPARAGFTTLFGTSLPPHRDHPRSRGVYGGSTSPSPAITGSSPLARGLRRHRPGRSQPGRIIPARAGFTGNGFVVCQFVKDHPRSRGVYWMHDGSSNSEKGSSPLARGLPGPGGAGQFPVRIIPARAGFTLRSANFALETQDHPRSRGVYPDDLVIFASPEGSSPLARGLRRKSRHPRRIIRIIPARAGFTVNALLISILI